MEIKGEVKAVSDKTKSVYVNNIWYHIPEKLQGYLSKIKKGDTVKILADEKNTVAFISKVSSATKSVKDAPKKDTAILASVLEDLDEINDGIKDLKDTIKYLGVSIYLALDRMFMLGVIKDSGNEEEDKELINSMMDKAKEIHDILEKENAAEMEIAKGEGDEDKTTEDGEHE